MAQASVFVSRINLSATETQHPGANDTFAVYLSSQPTADVHIHFAGDGVAIFPPVLTFTAQTWSHPANLTVMALDDRVAEVNNPPSLVNNPPSLVQDRWAPSLSTT